LEKSLGAVAKGGTTNLVEVYGYARRVDKPGLVFMDSPGFDPMSATGQVAGGANLIVFTTGRGSCFGCRPAPSIKLATNTTMFTRMEDDMDINCGTILEGQHSIEAMGQIIFDEMIATASGKPTKSESLGYGDDERDYGVGSRILLEAGYHRVILMTNNPRKVQGISTFGVEVVERRPAEIPALAENYRYLKSKKEKLGHLLDGV
jgi:hypothetical protein